MEHIIKRRTLVQTKLVKVVNRSHLANWREITFSFCPFHIGGFTWMIANQSFDSIILGRVLGW
jgi:hypothetical protein